MLKEKIIRHLKEAGRPLLARDIRRNLRLSSRDQGLFTGMMKKLAREGRIRRIEGNWYAHPDWAMAAMADDDPVMDVTLIVREAGLPESFPDAVEEEARDVSRGSRREAGSDRLDLRDRIVFTIDPDEAKDFDDAVSIVTHDDGWTLGVHIADVSHFVVDDSRLDAEAYSRGTSVYLVDRVLPMLPEQLSNDVCSLRPDEDRLTVSCFIRLDSAGRPQDIDLNESVIRSRGRLTYTEAQRTLDGQSDGLSPEIESDLLEMGRLAKILMKNREQRGALDLDLPEPRVTLDADGYVTGVGPYPRFLSHRLIEEFMILANEAVATWGVNLGLPFIFRVHEEPDRDSLEDFRHFLKALKLPQPKGKSMGPEELNDTLYKVRGTPVEPLVSRVLLRHMRQAEYRIDNVGHFGLASRAYTHFTSPIRRYPDLIVHRLLKRYSRAAPVGNELEDLEGWLIDAAEHSGERERVAMEAERDSIRLKQVAWLEGMVGDTFDGLVTAVMEFGLFVELDGYFVDGLIHVSELDDDYYRFEPDRFRLTGERHGRKYRLGDQLTVQLVRADRVTRQVDLVPFVEEEDGGGGNPGG